MLNMSFYNGTLDREELRKFIEETDKPIRFTHGFKYKSPTTRDVPVDKEEALKIVERESMLDAKELEDVLDLNAYSGNDMW